MAAAKRNNLSIFLIVILILMLGGLLYWWSRGPDWDWNPSYSCFGDEPYDTQDITELLRQGSGDRFHMITDTIYRSTAIDSVPPGSSVVFIGSEMYLDSADTQFMLEFVDKGNNAFFSASFIPRILLDSLLDMSTYYSVNGLSYYEYADQEVVDSYQKDGMRPMATFEDSLVELSLDHSDHSLENPVPCVYEIEWSASHSYWPYFKDSLITHEMQYADVLGQFNKEYVNFIRIPYGKGNFFLHSTPLAFSNYILRDQRNMEYARDCFSYLGKGNVYFDEKDSHYDPMNYKDDYNPLPPEKGPLAFILSERSLRNAWYTMLAVTVLYLIFGLRRKQRVIPVNENMANTSIEYAEVVSQMFMKESDHKKLVLLKMEVFRSFLRERFALRLPVTVRDEDESFYNQVAEKSGVPVQQVSDIFRSYIYLSSLSTVETSLMLEFYHKLESFYVESK